MKTETKIHALQSMYPIKCKMNEEKPKNKQNLEQKGSGQNWWNKYLLSAFGHVVLSRWKWSWVHKFFVLCLERRMKQREKSTFMVRLFHSQTFFYKTQQNMTEHKNLSLDVVFSTGFLYLFISTQPYTFMHITMLLKKADPDASTNLISMLCTYH